MKRLALRDAAGVPIGPPGVSDADMEALRAAAEQAMRPRFNLMVCLDASSALPPPALIVPADQAGADPQVSFRFGFGVFASNKAV